MKLEQRDDGRAACPFDHHSPEYAEHFAEILDELRDQAPIAWTDAHGGYWVVTRYDLVRRLAMDNAVFRIDPGEGRPAGIRIPPSPGSAHRPRFVPGETDGEEHDN